MAESITRSPIQLKISFLQKMKFLVENKDEIDKNDQYIGIIQPIDRRFHFLLSELKISMEQIHRYFPDDIDYYNNAIINIFDEVNNSSEIDNYIK